MTKVFEKGRFRFGDYELAYEIHGNSGVSCVLLHGLLLDSLVNRDLAKRFATQGYRVILLDLLGHGESDKPTDPRELRVDFFAEQTLALLDHLGIEKALIGGVSLGAITALQVAAKAPERCLGLFIEMPVMEWSTMFAALLLVPVITLVDYGSFVVRPFARLVRRIPRPNIDLVASFLNAASAEPEVITAVLHGILVGPVVPPAARRRQLTMPTLVVGHRGDRLHAHRDAAELAREMPNARLLETRWIGELRVTPDRLWPKIRAFLNEVSAVAGSAENPQTRTAAN
ncbi:MAG: alpha/beta hydrolase [Deltaproteobacteria bacterium]|nr:alpha/beta hydrolase [Deltaproteobacteria bacterium]